MSFNTHKLNDKGFDRLKTLKSKIVALKKDYEDAAMNRETHVDASGSRELSLAITKLEESSFWITKALASNPENHTEVVEY